MKNESNVIDAFGEADARVGGGRRKSAPVHMHGNERVTLYLTMAGLLEGGFTMKEAVGIIADEYRNSKLEIQALSAEIFFGGLWEVISGGAGTDGDEEQAPLANPRNITSLAVTAFGRGFVSTEEMALLRSLACAKDPAAILRTASAVVSLQHEGSLKVMSLSKRV